MVPDKVNIYDTASSDGDRLLSFMTTCTAVLPCTATVDKVVLMIYKY